MSKTILHKSLFSILSVAMLASCYDEDAAKQDKTNNENRISLTSEIEQVAQTRVNDNGFCDGDVIGVYIVDYLGSTPGILQNNANRGTNVKHTFDEAAHKWNSTFDIYWKDEQTHIDVYGYYPFGTPTEVNAYAHEVAKDQSKTGENGNLGGYESSDFLWGKVADVAPTERVIRLPLRHKMGSARITLTQGDGFADGVWNTLEKSVLVLNTSRNAIINLTDGKVGVAGNISSTGIIPYKKDDTFRSIVVPQSISASTPLFSITVDGVSYSFKKEETFAYASGKMHNFTIRINRKENSGKYEFVLVGESITAWENDDVSHDATAKEYIVIKSTAGKLKEAIIAAKKDYKKLQNLKITGEINGVDFSFMRNEMEMLQALNLKEVKIKAVTFTENSYVIEGKEDQIPQGAMTNKTSLLRLVLPDKLKEIGRNAFENCKYLSGSLIIPEGVTFIDEVAFNNCKSLTGSLSLPSTLEKLGRAYNGAAVGIFRECGFVGELKLPAKLVHIGHQAFYACKGLYGELHLPDNLTYLGQHAFGECVNFTGSLTIPQTLTQIEERTFQNCGFNGVLTLHSGVTAIGESAFNGCSLKGELNLPKELMIINDDVFNGCDFSGELKLPKKLAVIGNNAFKDNWRLMGILEIPENVQSIGAGAFAHCRNIEGIIFPASLENIRWESAWGDVGGAFSNCFGIGSIVCKGQIPAYIQLGAFNGVAKDNFTLEVPESAVQQYKAAVGWSDFTMGL